MKRMILFFLSLSLLSSVSIAQEMKISMLPKYYSDKQTRMLTPLAEFLSKEIKIPVTSVIVGTHSEYGEQINNGTIQIGYQDPLTYVNISGFHEVVAMAMDQQGGDKYRGIIITRSNSGINYLKDLRNKKIIIMGKNSAGGFLSQKLTLQKAGIDVEKDCKLEVALEGKQENVIIAVSVGDADAGFIRESSRFVADQYIQPGSIRVMSYCEWLPNWSLSVNRKLPVKVKEAIQSSVLKLKENHSVLSALDIRGFLRVDDSQYDAFREQIGVLPGN